MSFKDFLNESVKLNDKDILPLENEIYGFLGVLLTNDIPEDQINKKYKEIAKELAKNWGITDPVTIQKLLDSKVGRWMADSFIGMNKNTAKEIVYDVLRTKDKAKKLAKEYANY